MNQTDILDLRSPTMMSALDMARWIAAAEVFLSHLRNPLFLGYGAIPASDRNIAVQAWYFLTGWHGEAVVVFFVLSGLLVGGAGVARLRTGTFDSTDYVVDRVTRVFLPFLPALFIGYVLDLVGQSAFATVGFWDHTQAMIAQKIDSAPFGSSLSVVDLLGNILMVQHYFVPPLGSNQPLWTISGEFWFYVVFLCAAHTVVLGRTWRARTAAIATMAGIFGFLGLEFAVLLGLWCVGVLIAFIPHGAWRRPRLAFVLFLCLLVATRLAQGRLDSTPLMLMARNYVIALSFAWLLLSLQGFSSVLLERLGKFNAFMASFSYSLYLIHFPLMLFILGALHATGRFPQIAHGFNPTDPMGLLLYVGTSVGVFFGAWLLSRATESKTPMLRRKLKMRLQERRTSSLTTQRSA